jgi:hypothetical protein
MTKMEKTRADTRDMVRTVAEKERKRRVGRKVKARRVKTKDCVKVSEVYGEMKQGELTARMGCSLEKAAREV